MKNKPYNRPVIDEVKVFSTKEFREFLIREENSPVNKEYDKAIETADRKEFKTKQDGYQAYLKAVNKAGSILNFQARTAAREKAKQDFVTILREAIRERAYVVKKARQKKGRLSSRRPKINLRKKRV